MLKTIALTTTLAALTVAGLAQTTQTTVTTTTTSWNDNPEFMYDTYNMGSIDINSLSPWKISKLVRRSLKDCNSNDAYVINEFVELAPPDQANALLKALAINFKQASVVRDEVAMARFGTDKDYAWLSYPALTWSNTPGQNSWSAINFDNTPYTNVTMGDNMAMIPLTDDQTRPMRMVMRSDRKVLDYDRATDLLCSQLSEVERADIREAFHPAGFDPQTYTNAETLDAVIHVIQSNASMADGLGRYAWYNHFDKDYYTRHHMNW
jgi:hypothetical protein